MTSSRIRVALFDYGAGNLHSLVKALDGPEVALRVEVDLTRAADRERTDLLVLPGVGAFGAAARKMERGADAVRRSVERGMHCFGVCLGMQLLFDVSEEGEGKGLGLVPGVVRRLRAARVPQIGWNDVQPVPSVEPLLGDSGLCVAYFANSFVCEPRDASVVAAWTEHEADRFASAVRAGPRGRVVGVQFHPEKSSMAGVAFTRAVIARVAEERDR